MKRYKEIRTLRRRAVTLSCIAVFALVTSLFGCSASDKNARTVVISFHGGGADQGFVDFIEAKVGETIALPQNRFTREGHTFEGWTWTADADGKPLEPGTEIVVEDEAAYVAAWREIGVSSAKQIDWDLESTWAEIDVAEGDTELVGTMGNWKGKEPGGVILVTNTTKRTIDLEATLTLVQTSGNDWTSQQTSAYAVSPGSSRLLHVYDSHRSDGLRWRIEVTDSPSWKGPLQESLGIEEVETDTDHVTVRLSNTGTHVVQIASARIVATTKDGTAYAGDAFRTGRIEPGASMDVTFTTNNMYEFDAFESFDKTERAYYIDGYANRNQ